MKRAMISVVVFLSLGWSAVSAWGSGPYAFTTIDFPGAGCTVTCGINRNGRIVGLYSTDSSCSATHGYLLDQKGTFSTIDVPGASFTTAQGINDRGEIVGVYGSSGSDRGCLLDRKGTFTIKNVSGVLGTEALGISTPRQIVGSYTLTGDGSNQGFWLTAGTFTTIDPPGSSPNGSTQAFGINNSGLIVGRYGTSGAFVENHGYLLANGVYTTIDVPGASVTEARGINDLGQIVGDYQDQSGLHGYLLDLDGSFTTIDFPGAASTSAYGIDKRGDIVGSYVDASGQNHGFVATPGLR